VRSAGIRPVSLSSVANETSERKLATPPFIVKWGTQVRRHPSLDKSPNMLRRVEKLQEGGPFKVVTYTSEWALGDLGFKRIRPTALNAPGTPLLSTVFGFFL